MGLPCFGETTLVFQLINKCPCEACPKKMRKHLLQIHGIGPIYYNADEGSLTIQGNNIDPTTVIKELEKIKKFVKLITKEDPTSTDQLEEEQFAVQQTEVFEEQANALVVDEPPVIYQVLDESALSITPYFLSKHEHQHEFELKNYDKRFTCDGCKEEGFGKRHRCKYCNYELHKDCIHPKRIISHELFEESTFEFSSEKPLPTCEDPLCKKHIQSCEACGNQIHGCFYHCKAKGLSLHPTCADFKAKRCIEGSTFVLKNKASSRCFWCNDKSEKGPNSGWSYVSEKDYKCQLHVNCISKMAQEIWKQKSGEGNGDALSVVLEQRMNLGLVKKSKKDGWSKGGKLLKIILTFARTIIGIILGDPTAILASAFIELIKK